MLPTSNQGHAVSIVRSKRPGDNRLILIDSNKSSLDDRGTNFAEFQQKIIKIDLKND